MAEKQNGRGARFFQEPLGGGEIFQGSVENPLRVQCPSYKLRPLNIIISSLIEVAAH
jgi:hypothetical protein